MLSWGLGTTNPGPPHMQGGSDSPRLPPMPGAVLRKGPAAGIPPSPVAGMLPHPGSPIPCHQLCRGVSTAGSSLIIDWWISRQLGGSVITAGLCLPSADNPGPRHHRGVKQLAGREGLRLHRDPAAPRAGDAPQGTPLLLHHGGLCSVAWPEEGRWKGERTPPSHPLLNPAVTKQEA